MVDVRKVFRRLGVVLNLRDPPNVPAYGWSYFDHLVARYVTLNKDDKRADAVIRKSSERPDDLKWGDIFLLENIVFALQPPEVMKRNAWVIRERFREIACVTIYEKYVQSGVPTDADTPEKLALLTADLSRIQDVLHWHYSLIPIREHIRKKLTSNCIAMVALYTVVLGFALYYLRKPPEHNFLAMVACVLYFGIIGGFVSSQRRMQSIPTDTDPLISIFGLDNAGYYLWLSPLLGAIFAVILTLMFIAGILKGTVFPGFVPQAGAAATPIFGDFAVQALPTGAVEWAKLFVWAFLAGFAERLVPDSLDRLSSKMGPAKQAIPGYLGDTSPAADPYSSTNGGTTSSKEPVSKETIENVLHSGEIAKSTEPAKNEDTVTLK